MNEENKVHFCIECEKDTFFKTISCEETLKVKDLMITNEHEYLKCSNCGELFEPFDSPEKNLLADYKVYRELKGFMQPEEIQLIRKKYQISQRVFAKITGISYSTISNIENGSLQNKEQDSIFRMASDPYAFMMLIKRRKMEITSDEYSKLLKILKKLCITSYIEHKELFHEFRNETISKLNEIQFDLKELKNNENKSVDRKGELKWHSNSNKKVLNLDKLVLNSWKI